MATTAESLEREQKLEGIGCARKRKEDPRFVQGKGWTPVPGGPDPRSWLVDDEIGQDTRQLVAQLTELADAAAELRQAQRQHLEPSPLDALTEQTRQLTEVITAADHLDYGGAP